MKRVSPTSTNGQTAVGHSPATEALLYGGFGALGLALTYVVGSLFGLAV